MVFHSGEIEVQRRAGVRHLADEVADGTLDFVSDRVADFLRGRQFAVLASVDAQGRCWASVVTGEPGFISELDPHILRLGALPPAGDPLIANLAGPSHAALLAYDFVNPRRVRINGTGVVKDGAIYMQTNQVYGNCRRYIQERALTGSRRSVDGEATHSAALSDSQHELIANANTFFIATDHPQYGADISHKGGAPGFIRVNDARRLSYPDYNGNSMFNTLGNLAINPHAGLLFIDFDSGRTLQLTGRASVDWSFERTRALAGAERVVDFEAGEIIEHSAGFPLLTTFRKFSPFNPKK